MIAGEGVRELIWQDRDRDDMVGAAGEFAVPSTEPDPPPAPEPFVIPPPDWDAEERDRLARERADQCGGDGGERLQDEEQYESVASLSATPAKKRRRAPKTPNLDAVREWREGA